MGKPGQLLLIISRDTLIAAEEAPEGQKIFRVLANLTRKGCHLLLTAAEPDHWFPTRGNVDNALGDQGRLKDNIEEAGGDLDGIYYVPRSLFTQDRNREGALRDILARYSASVENTLLISSSAPFLRAAERLDMEIQEIPAGDEGVVVLADVLNDLSAYKPFNTAL